MVVILYLDTVTQPDITFVLLYLIPIFTITWVSNRFIGYIVSVVVTVMWSFVHIYDIIPSKYENVPFMNGPTRLIIFILFVYILDELHKALHEEWKMARIDNMTNIFNARAFEEILEYEVERSHRYHHPLTLAYIDLDNFKIVNDTMGHHEGNRVLKEIAATLKSHTRSVDIVARVGGDEFVVLIPEVPSKDVENAVIKLSHQLLTVMHKGDWPVTFSIGVAQCLIPPCDSEELMRYADHLMYEAKRKGKNTVEYRLYRDSRRGLNHK